MVVAPLAMAGCTHPGRVRSHNEDSLYHDAGQGLAILADGMGGYNAGEVASGMAVTLLATQLAGAPAEAMPAACDRWRREITAANSAIFKAAEAQPQYAGMGTTLVGARFLDNQVCVAHLGDSRLYRLRNGTLVPLTRDHSFLQQQIDAGLIRLEDARLSEQRHFVTRALGIEPSTLPDIKAYEVTVGDLYLLCSDGLNDMIDDDCIARTLQADPDLQAVAARLVEEALDAGGQDNVSVILVRVDGDFGLPRSWGGRLMAWLK